jgi:hypothetical protein
MSLPIPIPTPTVGEIVSFFRKPKLFAFIPKDEPKIQEIQDFKRRAFYHIGVRNAGSVTIKSSRVYLNFEGIGRKVGILAKWDFKAEPLDSYNTLHVVPQLIVDSQVHDILPAVSETFAVFMKYEGEDEIYPFSAFSYLYPYLKEPHNKLGIGEYVVKAILVSENFRGSFSFRIKNKGKNFNDVSIEPLREYKGDKTFRPIKWE